MLPVLLRDLSPALSGQRWAAPGLCLTSAELVSLECLSLPAGGW